MSSIIVLYGALERYIEDAVEEYAKTVVAIFEEYGKLTDEFRNKHLRLTIEYLAQLKEGRVRETESIETIVGALHGCLSGAVPFQLNSRAFSLRSANMNLERIFSIMGNIEVKVTAKRIVSNPAYAELLLRAEGIVVNEMKGKEIEAALDHVDELVQRIAHGVTNLMEIEGNAIVRERAERLRSFVTSVNGILFSELLAARISLNHLVPIHGPVQVFGDDIACFAWPSGRLAPGDILVMRPADETAELRHGAILSIQIDSTDQAEVEGKDGLMVGVRVPFRVKANGSFFVWTAPT